jgi:hypothetical protein
MRHVSRQTHGYGPGGCTRGEAQASRPCSEAALVALDDDPSAFAIYTDGQKEFSESVNRCSRREQRYLEITFGSRFKFPLRILEFLS